MRREIPDAIRGAAGPGRARRATIATDSVTQVYDVFAGRIIDEVLLIDGATWREPAPLLVDHDRAVPSMVGSATGFRKEPGKLTATLRFAEGNDLADEAFALVDGGHLRDVSIGYQVLESIEVPPGDARTVAGRLFSAKTGPLRVVSKWRIREISLVPIGADEAAGVRSFPFLNETRNASVPVTSAIPQREVAHMTGGQYAAACLKSRGGSVPENPFEALRTAFSSVDGLSDLLGIFSQPILDGYRAASDSLAGVYRTVDAPNYLQRELVNVTVHPRLDRVARGAIAPTVSFGLGSQSYRLLRCGLQFTVDDQDLLDGGPIGVFQLALREVGQAVRNLVSDLLYSVLLGNPNLADGTPLFDASRGNLSTDALAAAALDTGIAAVAGQTSVDAEGQPVHLGLSPQYLIVPPGLLGAARRLARNMAVANSRLSVRADSRLTATGVIDPRTGEPVAGNGTNWLLAAPGEQKAGVVLALLDGETEPAIRNFELTGGEFGYGFDVSFSCAAAAVAGEPLYWSTGAV